MQAQKPSQDAYAADERRWSAAMASAHRGDADAYAKLLTELAQVIEAYLRSRFGPLSGLEDCVQDSLLAIHKARNTYDPRRPIRPWLFTIVRHKTIDHLRRTSVRSAEPLENEALGASAQTQPRDPGDRIDGARLLAQLEPDYREALQLTKYAGYSLEEAARHSGVSQTAMKTRVHRALRKVRKMLESEVIAQ